MHWATFNRLREAANRAADELWGGPVGQGLLKGQERDMKKLDKICARIEARRG